MTKEIVKHLNILPIGHAADIEISYMLIRNPDLVHIEQATDNPNQAKATYHLDPKETDH